MGGAITGEHGVGMEKDRLMPLLFSEAELDLMRRVRDAFNPRGLLNPGKIFPTGKGCGETRIRPIADRGLARPDERARKNCPSRSFADIVGARTCRRSILATPCAFEVDGVAPARGRAAWVGARKWRRLYSIAAAENLAVIATGARTKLGIGMPPARYDLAIDMTRLDRRGRLRSWRSDAWPSKPEFRSQNSRECLAEQRQFLPLAVPFFDRTTVGGTIATGVDSPLRQSLRDGARFRPRNGIRDGRRVAREERRARGEERYRIRSAQIDDRRSARSASSRKMNFRTFPLPPATCGFVAAFDTRKRALDLRHRIARSPLAPIDARYLESASRRSFLQRCRVARFEGVPMRENRSLEHALGANSGLCRKLTRCSRATRATLRQWPKKPARSSVAMLDA